MCIELNLPAVEIELDAKLVVDLLKKADGNLNGNDVYVTDCKGPKKILRFKISHCFREANKCTDALAKRGALLSQDFVIFSSPLADVFLLLRLDAAGTLYERVCSCFSCLVNEVSFPTKEKSVKTNETLSNLMGCCHILV